LNNLEEIATSRRILPFPQPGAEAATITSDAVESASSLFIEIEDSTQASDLTACAGDLDAGKSGG
jgi:hypothetical protein